MSLFAIADTHLSFGSNKPMDDFEGWLNYTGPDSKKIGTKSLMTKIMLLLPVTLAGDEF